MRTHRFGQKIRLPSTTAIKHQLRTLMARDEVARVEAEAKAEAARLRLPGEQDPLVK